MNRVRFLSLSTIQAVDIIGEQTVQVTVGSANTELIYSFAAAIIPGTLISSAMLPALKEYYVDLNDTYGSAANVEKAKELMADAGYADGFDM